MAANDPFYQQLKTPSFRANANPFGTTPTATQTPANQYGATSSTPAVTQTQTGMQNTAVSSLAPFGTQNGAPAASNPNATPAASNWYQPQFDVTKTALYQAQQQAALNNFNPATQTQAFDAQANIARDAQKVAQMQAAKSVRDQLIGQGLKDSGQYLTQGIIGPADKAARDRADMERNLAVNRQDAVNKAQTLGTQQAGELSAELGQQQTQNFNLLKLGTDMQEADKARVQQTNMAILQNTFAKQGQNFDALMSQLQNMPADQAADTLKQVAIDAGITHPVIDPATGQQMKDPKTGQPMTLPGLQDYGSVGAATVLPVVNSWKSGDKMTADQSQAFVQGYAKLQGNANVASDWTPDMAADTRPKGSTSTDWGGISLTSAQKTFKSYADSHIGKLVKYNDGAYEIVGSRPGATQLKDVTSGKLTWVDDKGNSKTT